PLCLHQIPWLSLLLIDWERIFFTGGCAASYQVISITHLPADLIFAGAVFQPLYFFLRGLV
ncbi:MAG: hypothetical protein JAY72_10850, partial [Candidatus Thiodiazotropha endolucinida]|nr:hypothetical protein [Candidatus Thiodiazotropha taylori]MCW4322174.1 hypothetical protein [Candidatus Thiodiazotropha taylori]